jgi:hypothetical protein
MSLVRPKPVRDERKECLDQGRILGLGQPALPAGVGPILIDLDAFPRRPGELKADRAGALPRSRDSRLACEVHHAQAVTWNAILCRREHPTYGATKQRIPEDYLRAVTIAPAWRGISVTA